MKLSNLIEQNATLGTVLCYRKPDKQWPGFISVVEFRFIDEEPLFLAIDNDSDALFWSDSAPSGLVSTDFDRLFPMDKIPAKAVILWAWEMKNHRGYFDALQLEFASTGNSEPAIFQFKAAASDIEIHRLKIVRPNQNRAI